MMRALAIGATGMLAQQMNVDTISNNIANMTTTGFKRQRAEFADLMYQHQVRPGSATSDTGNIAPTGISVGSGVKPVGIYRINEQGSLQTTDNKLDMAVLGRGYFQVQLPSGETAYTRDGSFQMSAQGQIVTADGYLVQPAITVPANATDITINKSGQVFATVPGQATQQNLGQVQLATFVNDAGLEALGGNLLRETEASGTATVGNPNSDAFGAINQGSVENSNVNIVAEMTSLISAQRAYEMNSKVIKSADDLLQALNQIR
jgi:flagellar basal-body rod protein FlgG